MVRVLLQKFSKQKQDKPIIVVSGLPRSGTSMMMKMLEVGGLPPLVDHIRTADLDNPKGYYEFERVKKLPEGDHAWLVDARGKVVKVIAMLLLHLPATYTYRVIFMRRAMPEILASQRKMLINRGEDPDNIGDEEMARIFNGHLRQVNAWLTNQPNLEHLDVKYSQLVDGSRLEDIERINQFLGGELDVRKMKEVVDPDLYRHRKEAAVWDRQTTYPTMSE